MKKTINIALMFAAVVGAAATANAAAERVDMYGASAQKDYWFSMARDFMVEEMDCRGVAGVTAPPGETAAQKEARYNQAADRATFAGDTNYTVVKGINCFNLPVKTGVVHEDAYITYFSGASFEGVLAGAEKAPLAGNDFGGCAAASSNKNRHVVNPATCVFDSDWTTTDTCSEKECNDIEMGTSDVYVTSFKQVSDGYKKGHKNGGAYSVDLTDGTYAPLKDLIEAEIADGTIKVEYPTVVPFAFYVNPSVSGVTNLTRPQAVNIYSGTVTSWDQVPAYTGTAGKAVVKCLRHAGSGTHAALDMSVFRDDSSKGGGLLQYDDGTLVDGTTFFNFSSSDMKKCIKENGGHTNGYAVGYMDADQQNTAPLDYRMVSYQGANPYAAEIQNGAYDFWVKQNIYMKGTNTTMMDLMINYSKVNVPSNKATWWVAESTLNVNKITDASMPENR